VSHIYRSIYVYFQYGAYRHTEHEVNLVAFSQQTLEDHRGQVTRKALIIEGVLTGDTQSGLRSSINALVLGYSAGGRTAALYHDDGTQSSHCLDSPTSIGGVRVLKIGFPGGDAAEYATQRTYRIELEADYATGADNIAAWQETLHITGNGGPRFVFIEVQNGPPVKQLVSQASIVTAVQTGAATGIHSRPAPPSPIWPQAEQSSLRRISPVSPSPRGDGFTGYGIEWAYHFESATPLTGQPASR